MVISKPLQVFCAGWFFGILMLDLLWDQNIFHSNVPKSTLLMLKSRWIDIHQISTSSIFGQVRTCE
jgi:hypothetical protein